MTELLHWNTSFSREGFCLIYYSVASPRNVPGTHNCVFISFKSSLELHFPLGPLRTNMSFLRSLPLPYIFSLFNRPYSLPTTTQVS